DDGVFGETRVVEFLEPFAGIGVGLGDDVVVARPVLADLGRVGVVGGDAHLGGGVNRLVIGLANLAFVALQAIKDGKKGLSGLAASPVRLGRGVVPDLAGLGEVVVLLGIIGAIVTGFAEQLRKHFLAAGEGHHAGHVLGAGRRRIHSRDDRRAG